MPEVTATTHYRGYTIWYDPPPIPDRQFDWHYQHENFDGAPDAHDDRFGHEASLAACRAAIDAALDPGEDEDWDDDRQYEEEPND